MWHNEGRALGSNLSVLRTENEPMTRWFRYHPNGVRGYSPGRSPGVTRTRVASHQCEPSDRRGEATTKTLSTLRTTLSSQNPLSRMRQAAVRFAMLIKIRA